MFLASLSMPSEAWLGGMLAFDKLRSYKPIFLETLIKFRKSPNLPYFIKSKNQQISQPQIGIVSFDTLNQKSYKTPQILSI